MDSALHVLVVALLVASGFALAGCAQNDFYQAEETVAFELGWPPAISYDGTKYFFISWSKRQRYVSGFVYDVNESAYAPIHLPCGYRFIRFKSFSLLNGKHLASMVYRDKLPTDSDQKPLETSIEEIIVFDPATGRIFRKLESDRAEGSFFEIAVSIDDRTLFVIESTYFSKRAYSYDTETGAYKYLYPPKRFGGSFKSVTWPMFIDSRGYVSRAEIANRHTTRVSPELKAFLDRHPIYFLFSHDGSVSRWDGNTDFFEKTWYTSLSVSGAVSMKGNRAKLGRSGYSVFTYDGKEVKQIYDLISPAIRTWKISRNEKYLIVFAKQDPFDQAYGSGEPTVARIINMHTDAVVKDFYLGEIMAAFNKFKKLNKC